MGAKVSAHRPKGPNSQPCHHTAPCPPQLTSPASHLSPHPLSSTHPWPPTHATQHDALWGPLSAAEHLAVYGRLRGLAGGALAAAVQEGLAALGLASDTDHQGQGQGKGARAAGSRAARPSAALRWVGGWVSLWVWGE